MLFAFVLTAMLPVDGLTGAKNSDTPKILAKTNMRIADASMVIRSDAELAKVRKVDAEQASSELAKLLKVPSIDWSKQMVIVISGGVQRTGGYSVEAKSLAVKDKTLVVRWKLNTPPPGAFVIQALTHPSLAILTDRFDGKVEFDPKAPKGKKLEDGQ